MSKGMLLVAISVARLSGIFDIVAKRSFVVFGTMDGKVLRGLNASIADSATPSLPVYFYETG